MEYRNGQHCTASREETLSDAYSLVVLHCYRRRTLFSCLYTGGLVVHELQRSDAIGQTRTLAYAVLPDRVLWLFRRNASSELRSVVCQAKGRAALAIARARCQPSRIWETGYAVRMLTDPTGVLAARHFVIHQPVLQRLAPRPEDYPLAFAGSAQEDTAISRH